jgi:hypothetical protein
VLVQTDPQTTAIAGQIERLDGFEFAEDVRGPYDAVAVTRSDGAGDGIQVILDEIRRLPGVIRALAASSNGTPHDAPRPTSWPESPAQATRGDDDMNQPDDPGDRRPDSLGRALEFAARGATFGRSLSRIDEIHDRATGAHVHGYRPTCLTRRGEAVDTRLLLPLLWHSAPARIVNVSAVGRAAIDFDDPMLKRRYRRFPAQVLVRLAPPWAGPRHASWGRGPYPRRLRARDGPEGDLPAPGPLVSRTGRWNLRAPAEALRRRLEGSRGVG